MKFAITTITLLHIFLLLHHKKLINGESRKEQGFILNQVYLKHGRETGLIGLTP